MSRGDLLPALRQLLTHHKLAAYIIPSGDAHFSEYVAACDQRRAFISGFDGSAGSAIVTQQEALMWTDGRYFTQAVQQMSSSWTLMKLGVPQMTTQADWLSRNLPSSARVGVDPLLITAEAWRNLSESLDAKDQLLVPLSENLVDVVWTEQPPRPASPLEVMTQQTAGRSWQEKVALVREKMRAEEAQSCLITALDEVAWLFNLRGCDVPYNPVFFSYTLVTPHEVLLYADPTALSDAVRHLLSGVTLLPYHSAVTDLQARLARAESRVWLSHTCSQALAAGVPPKLRFIRPTPVGLLKAVKNPAEVAGMRRAHVRDGVALARYYSWLERQVTSGATLNEVEAASKLEKLYSEQAEWKGLSFPTISGSGPNGAIIHYQPTAETARSLSTGEMYLCDSGSQYSDGTTDVTRTWHWGQPSEEERDAYTRVFRGHVALSRVVFPEHWKGGGLDVLARSFLWEGGLNYNHGTGHGVGHYLNVHEGPCGIGAASGMPRLNEAGLEEGMVLTDEPGYYKEGEFGIRIENVILVVPAQTSAPPGGRKFLTFEPLTLAPMCVGLLQLERLTAAEKKWLNEYHARVVREVGPQLSSQGDSATLTWLEKQCAAV